MTEQKRTYTVEETARALGVSRGTAYAGVHTGDIPSLRVGRRLLVPRHALEKLLAGADKGPTAA